MNGYRPKQHDPSFRDGDCGLLNALYLEMTTGSLNPPGRAQGTPSTKQQRIL